MTTIGDRVRAAMQAASLRQNQLAQRVGMTPPDALSRALSGIEDSPLSRSRRLRVCSTPTCTS